jgi:hypothetical protein
MVGWLYWAGDPFVVFDRLRERGVPTGLSVMVGGAYWTRGALLSSRKFDVAIGAGGAVRMGTMGEDTPPPGARGAGRCGMRVVPFGGDRGPAGSPGVLLGIGGGARGFSKLSVVLLGKRGLCGGLRGVMMPLMCGLSVLCCEE